MSRNLQLHMKERVGYSDHQLFHMVADVSSYPSFLPWCQKCTVIKKEGNTLWADLQIGYGPFSASFRSRVLLQEPFQIVVHYEEGPFKDLQNYWKFEAIEENETMVEFFISFRLHSSFMQHAMEKVFKTSSTSLLNAFEKRAAFLYGNKR